MSNETERTNLYGWLAVFFICLVLASGFAALYLLDDNRRALVLVGFALFWAGFAFRAIVAIVDRALQASEVIK